MTLTATADAPAGRVWIKTRWADPWVHAPHLIPTQSSEVLSPELSTATLYCAFGVGMLPGFPAIQPTAPVTTAGYFVLIQWFDATSSRWWLGFAGRAVTTPLRAAFGGVPTAGAQTIPCYGLERVFQLARIDTTVSDTFLNSPGGGTAPWYRYPGGATFNAGDVGNRLDSDDWLIFARPRSTVPRRWSSRQIIQHLLTFHLPPPTGSAVGIPWQIGDLSPVPDWDAPTVATDGRSLAECLDEVLSRDRLLGWRLVPDITPPVVVAPGMVDPPAVTAVTVQAISRAATPIVLPGHGRLPAADTLHALHTGDPLTRLDLTDDSSDLADQVIVEGPREISVCSSSLRSAAWTGNWTSGQFDDYHNGAQATPEWSTYTHEYQRRQALDRHRRRPSLANVYASFVLNRDWTGIVGTTFHQTLAFDPTHDADRYWPSISGTEILPDLPLLVGVDYSGQAAGVDESAGHGRRPLFALIARPGTGSLPTPTYDLADRIGQTIQALAPETAGINLGITLQPDHRFGPGLQLQISGGPAHALDSNVMGAQYSVYRGYDYRDITLTMALRGERRPFVAIPESPPPPGLDFLQRRVIRIDHPALQHVYIPPGTIVDTDSAGRAIRSEGGVLRDPLPLLRSLAILAAESWCKPARRVDIETARLLSTIHAGDVVASVDGSPLSATVLEVRVDAPIGHGDEPAAALTTRITAATTRIDPIRMMRPAHEDPQP